MKFLALLSATAFAQNDQTSQQRERLDNLCANQPECAAVMNSIGNDTFRSMAVTMQPVWEYGCWCYFQADHGRGRGLVQNEVDGICQVLHHGYTCIKMDAQTDPDMLGCDPFGHTYNLQQTLGNENQELEMQCITSNPGDKCAQAICLVEAKFILNFIQIGTTPGFVFDASLKHSLGIFDPDTCVVGANGGSNWVDDQCCGNYPTRFPFKSKDGARACCGHRTYSVALQQCCLDGTVNVSC